MMVVKKSDSYNKDQERIPLAKMIGSVNVEEEKVETEGIIVMLNWRNIIVNQMDRQLNTVTLIKGNLNIVFLIYTLLKLTCVTFE